MRAAQVGAGALLLLALGGPAEAASPSPSPAPSPSASPEDRSTTVSVSPTAAPDRSTVLLRGFSDCAVIDGHLLFTTYDGKADNVVVRATSKTYDYDREKYPFSIRLTVPATAAPGAAKVYAEPFCGPPEEYPPSGVIPFRVERSSLVLRLSPRRPASGDRLHVRARTCDGGRGSLTVRVRDGGATRDLRGTVDATGAMSLWVRVTAGGDVSLPRAAGECRGSSYDGSVSYDVLQPVDQPSPTSSAVASATAAVPSRSAAATTAAPASPTPTALAASRSATRHGRGRAWLVGVAAAAVVAMSAAVAVVFRRRRTAP